MHYEFHHVWPRGVSAVQMTLESDKTAMSFADLIENGAPVEVYAEGALIGRVEPRRRQSIVPKARRIIALLPL